MTNDYRVEEYQHESFLPKLSHARMEKQLMQQVNMCL